MGAKRLEAGTGLAGAVLSFGGMFMVFSNLPKVDDPVDDYVSFVVDNRGQILTGFVLFAIAIGLLVWWAAALRASLATADEATRTLPDLVLAAAVLAFSSGFAGFTPLAALAWRGPDGIDAHVVRLVVDTLSVLFTVLSAVPFFVFVLSGALAMRRTGSFPAALAWLGVAAATANGVFVFGLFARDGIISPYSPVGIVAALLLFVWIGAASVVMMRRLGDRAVIG